MSAAKWHLELGDVVDVLRDYEDNVFDAVLCDPPYGLSFMGKRWDYEVPSVELWAEVLRVCKPGAPLLAAFGTRTYHRGVVRIEDAGWEIRDAIAWMYGSGFPKSLDVSKAIDAHERGAMVRTKLLYFAQERGIDGRWLEERGVASASSFKDWTIGGHVPSDKNWQIVKAALGVTPEEEAAFERAVIGRSDNGIAGGSGAHAGNDGVYGFRASFDITATATPLAAHWSGYGTALKPAHEPYVLARKPLDGTVAENVARWGVGALAIDACRVGPREGDDYGRSAANANGTINAHEGFGGKSFAIAERSGEYAHDAGRWPANVILDEEAGAAHEWSRFFYCAKASKAERNAGCDALPMRTGGEATGREDDSAGLSSPRAGAGRTGGSRNHHPTVKPIALCEYLARLIVPPTPGVLLVPFAGSGSEMIGALRAGWPAVVGIERESEYVEIAQHRLRHHEGKAA